MNKFAKFILFVVVTAAMLLFYKWIFETTMAMDIPNWLKYAILR